MKRKIQQNQSITIWDKMNRSWGTTVFNAEDFYGRSRDGVSNVKGEKNWDNSTHSTRYFPLKFKTKTSIWQNFLIFLIKYQKLGTLSCVTLAMALGGRANNVFALPLPVISAPMARTEEILPATEKQPSIPEALDNNCQRVNSWNLDEFLDSIKDLDFDSHQSSHQDLPSIPEALDNNCQRVNSWDPNKLTDTIQDLGFDGNQSSYQDLPSSSRKSWDMETTALCDSYTIEEHPSAKLKYSFRLKENRTFSKSELQTLKRLFRSHLEAPPEGKFWRFQQSKGDSFTAIASNLHSASTKDKNNISFNNKDPLLTEYLTKTNASTFLLKSTKNPDIISDEKWKTLESCLYKEVGEPSPGHYWKLGVEDHRPKKLTETLSKHFYFLDDCFRWCIFRDYHLPSGYDWVPNYKANYIENHRCENPNVFYRFKETKKSKKTTIEEITPLAEIPYLEGAASHGVVNVEKCYEKQVSADPFFYVPSTKFSIKINMSEVSAMTKSRIKRSIEESLGYLPSGVGWIIKLEGNRCNVCYSFVKRRPHKEAYTLKKVSHPYQPLQRDFFRYISRRRQLSREDENLFKELFPIDETTIEKEQTSVEKVGQKRIISRPDMRRLEKKQKLPPNTEFDELCICLPQGNSQQENDRIRDVFLDTLESTAKRDYEKAGTNIMNALTISKKLEKNSNLYSYEARLPRRPPEPL